MKVEYFGHSCFRIETESGVKILTDPYTKVGYELPKGLNADIVCVSHGHFDHNYVQAVQGNPQIVDAEGEYEIQGVKIEGIATWHDPKQGALRGKNIIFKIQVDGVTFCHFGDLGEEYSDKFEKILKNTDVWMIPIGGTYTIDAEQAKTYIEKCSPKAVIPMHYLPSDGTLDIAPAEVFLEMMKDYPIATYPLGEMQLNQENLSDNMEIFYMERK